MKPPPIKIRRRWGRTFLAATGVCAVLLLATAWYTTTDSFREWLRNHVVVALQDATGGKVELGAFHMIPFRLQIEARDLTIHGTEAAGSIPLGPGPVALRPGPVALGPGISVAILAVDHASGEILSRVASADYFDAARAGQVDMTQALRSPGSTLKPFIYGFGFEDGFIHPETLIEDRPARYGSYAPENFDLSFQGTVTIRMLPHDPAGRD
jgi:hypothetical protein